MLIEFILYKQSRNENSSEISALSLELATLMRSRTVCERAPATDTVVNLAQFVSSSQHQDNEQLRAKT